MIALDLLIVVPEYSGAGEVPFEPLSESFSPFVSLLGVTQPEGESGRVLQRNQECPGCIMTS